MSIIEFLNEHYAAVLATGAWILAVLNTMQHIKIDHKIRRIEKENTPNG